MNPNGYLLDARNVLARRFAKAHFVRVGVDRPRLAANQAKQPSTTWEVAAQGGYCRRKIVALALSKARALRYFLATDATCVKGIPI